MPPPYTRLWQAREAASKIAQQESRQNVPVNDFKGCRSAAVVPARQYHCFVRQAMLPELADDLLRQVQRKCQVVLRIYEQAVRVAHAAVIRRRADGSPQLSQQIEIDVAVQAPAHVLGR